MKKVYISLPNEVHAKLLKIRDMLRLDNLDEAVASVVEKTYAAISKEEQT